MKSLKKIAVITSLCFGLTASVYREPKPIHLGFYEGESKIIHDIDTRKIDLKYYDSQIKKENICPVLKINHGFL